MAGVYANVDISWKGYQEFPDFTVTCPKCSQTRSSGDSKLQTGRRNHCRWGPQFRSTVLTLDASHNLIQTLSQGRLSAFVNLKSINLSSNRLKELPEEISFLPNLREIYASNNVLRTLPKSLICLKNIEILNFSGNALDHIPPVIFEMASLKSLQLGANRITEVSKMIVALQSLEDLYLGGNQIQSIPVEVGEMKNLSSLKLCDNRLTSIPVELVKLRNLQSLSLHNNQLTYLPREIVELVNLVELSLRGNPMVIRFVQDLSCDPPSLVELASRVVKNHKLPYRDLPVTLVNHLNSAKKCPNSQCSGVYFQSKYHQIKFVDFCGKYRLPLMQYLCSPKCISYSSCSSAASSETESGEEELGVVHQPMMRRVLLG